VNARTMTSRVSVEHGVQIPQSVTSWSTFFDQSLPTNFLRLSSVKGTIFLARKVSMQDWRTLRRAMKLTVPKCQKCVQRGHCEFGN
jgi:hypothetical protein